MNAISRRTAGMFASTRTWKISWSIAIWRGASGFTISLSTTSAANRRLLS